MFLSKRRYRYVTLTKVKEEEGELVTKMPVCFLTALLPVVFDRFSRETKGA
jgi:hypothetical protein